MRAAASSTANGSPSTRRQISATMRVVSSVRLKSARTADARCAKRMTQGFEAASASASAAAGTGRGGTANSISPCRWSSSREVASTDSPGAASRSPATVRAPSRTCSKLSVTSRSVLSRRCSRMTSSTGMSGASRSSNAEAMASGTRAGSSIMVSGAKYTPSPKRGSSLSAAATASRVFPLPPGPVRVTRRERASSPEMSASSWSRPMKLVSCAGRCLGRVSIERMGGNSARSPGAVTW